jgi:hypothetical protein
MQKLNTPIIKLLKIMSKNTMDKDDDLTQEEQEYILSEAMSNAYIVATGKISYNELEESGSYWFPDLEDTDTMLQPVIDYYSDLEEYEKCQELKNIMDKEGRYNPMRAAVLARHGN